MSVIGRTRLSRAFSAGDAFRWLPSEDVTGDPLPRPGTGKPILLVFGAGAESMVSAAGWSRIVGGHSNVNLIAILRGDKKRVITHAAKVKVRQRMFLVADENNLLHRAFNATQRAFIIAGSGKIGWSMNLAADGWNPSGETFGTISAKLAQIGA